MNAEILDRVRSGLTGSWLTGPILDKELRVSARRKRNYVLRFVYLGLLTFFIGGTWYAIVDQFGSRYSGYALYSLSEVGKGVISSILWFQFITAQLIAVIMLSTAISDEIYNKTLGILMTTPINSFQIVMGKLFSKLLQLLLLLGMSLPLLGIVRVFGGVPWDFVVSSLCITITAVIFAASVSLYHSIGSRRAYAVILKTFVTGLLLFILVPTITVYLLRNWIGENPEIAAKLGIAAMHAHPFFAMSFNYAMMVSPMGMGAGAPTFYWWAHCLTMLALSALVLCACVSRVRKVGLRQATGSAGEFPSRRKARAAARKSKGKPIRDPAPRRIRAVKGSPVIWKELRAPVLRGGRISGMIGASVAIIALLITYVICAREDCLDTETSQTVYVHLFVLLGMLFSVILGATSITAEKESRCWPILLGTPLSDWHVLMGKAVGTIRKCLPIWLLLAGHVLLFTIAKYIHPITILHLALLVTWIVVFLTGTGLYFGARFKRTTTAVIMNLGLAAAIWIFLPIVVGFFSFAVADYDETLVERVLRLNPMIQTQVIMSEGGGKWQASKPLSSLRYDWPGPDGPAESPASTTVRMIAYAMFYIAAGAMFAWRAKANFRKRVF